MNPETANVNQKSYRLFAAALFVAAAVRFYLLWQYYCISSDGIYYIEAAKDFFAGNIAAGLASVYPPGYPVLIAAVFPLVGDWELAGQLLSLLFGVLLLWPLYLLFRDVYNERVAVIACFLAAVSPFLARYSAHVRTESPFLFFSVLALLLFDRAIENKLLGYFLYGGLAAGFAYLVRPEALGFLVIVPAFLGFRWLIKKEPGISRIVTSSTVVAAAFMVFALPYIVYLSIDTGHWGAVSRKAGVTLAISLGESGLLQSDDGSDGANAESQEFVELIRRHPGQYLKKVALGFFPAVWAFFEALHFTYVPFLLLGWFVIFRERFWERKDFLILVFVGFYIFAFMLIYVKRRYSLQVVPVSLGWAALGMIWIWRYLNDTFSSRTRRVVALLLSVAFLAGTLPKTLSSISRDKAYIREAGWYLRERNSSGGLNVAVIDVRITFYARANAILIFGTEESALPGQLREGKADYLAMDAKAWRKFYPRLAAQPDRYGLALAREFVGSRKDRVFVFKVM